MSSATELVEVLTGLIVDVYGSANARGALATPPEYLRGVHDAVIEAYDARNGDVDEEAEAVAARRAGIEARAEELRAELAELDREIERGFRG